MNKYTISIFDNEKGHRIADFNSGLFPFTLSSGDSVSFQLNGAKVAGEIKHIHYAIENENNEFQPTHINVHIAVE